MIVGIPRSRLVDENRVGLPPRAVGDLTGSGIEVIVEHNAGRGSGFGDEQYDAAGARIVHSPEEVYGRADILVKVNKPEADEYDLLRQGQVVVALLHLAVADRRLLDELLTRQCTAIDLATVQDERGHLPVLRPLSQIAGRMVPQIAAFLGTTYTEGNVMFAVAGVVSATAPLFVLVMFFQRQIVSGVTAGAVKG